MPLNNYTVNKYRNRHLGHTDIPPELAPPPPVDTEIRNVAPNPENPQYTGAIIPTGSYMQFMEWLKKNPGVQL